MDLLIASFALLVLLPLMLIIGAAVRFASGKPILFRQRRTGRYGREFRVLKFRTMVPQGSETEPGITRAGDPRITTIGKWLRKLKLDELPQLINVISGEMSLVGPRPDISDFWEQASAESRRALTLVPGLTGAASIAFHNEEDLLGGINPEQLTTFYAVRLVPLKARIDLQYAAQATFLSDCGVLLRTLIKPLQPHRCRTLHEHLSRQ